MKHEYVLMSVVVSALIFFIYFVPHLTEESVTITVTDKERIVTGSGDTTSSKYLVFTEAETFENTDSLARFKFDSSDIQGQLKIGTEYTVLVYGWRVPVLSMYRNIVRIEKVNHGE